MPKAPKIHSTAMGKGTTRQPVKERDDYKVANKDALYGRAWKKARKFFIMKHSLCKICQDKGHHTAAAVIDHIIPHRGDKTIFWDRKNWQPLCKPCHDHKTLSHDIRGYTPSTATPEDIVT